MLSISLGMGFLLGDGRLDGSEALLEEGSHDEEPVPTLAQDSAQVVASLLEPERD